MKIQHKQWHNFRVFSAAIVMVEMATYSVDDENRRHAEVALEHICRNKPADQLLIVLFGLGSYGDALQITGFLHHLRQRFAGALFVLIHPNRAVPSLLKEPGQVDCVCTTPEMYDYLAYKLASQNQADLFVYCRYVVTYSIPTNSRLGKADKEMVHEAKEKQRYWLPFLTSFPLDNDRLWRTAAARGFNMYSLMAETSGFTGMNFESLHLSLTSKDYIVRQQELPERYVVICNSAEALTVTRSTWTKILPAEKMTNIVGKLKALGIPSVLLGASKDDAEVGGVDYDLRGRSNLRQAGAILKDSAFFIAPEGGLANMAKAVGRSGVVCFCSTPPEFFAFQENINITPKTCGGCWWATPSYLYHCPRLLRMPECGQSIQEDEVIEAARSLM